MPVDERSGTCMQYCDKRLLPTVGHISFGMGFDRGERVCSDEVPDLFLCPVLSLHLSFQRGNFPLVSNPIFPKLPASAAPASAPLKAQSPIKLSYPCGKESFLSLPHSFTHSIHHLYHSPLFSITFLFLHYATLLEKWTCLNTIHNTN